MFIFSKLLSFIAFWASLVPKSEILQIERNLLRGTLLYLYFEFNVYFFKVFVIHISFGKFGPNT